MQVLHVTKYVGLLHDDVGSLNLLWLPFSCKYTQVKTHGQLLESLYNEIPQRLLPVEYLPDDYTGPNQGTEQQILGTVHHFT